MLPSINTLLNTENPFSILGKVCSLMENESQRKKWNFFHCRTFMFLAWTFLKDFHLKCPIIYADFFCFEKSFKLALHRGLNEAVSGDIINQ